MVKIETNKWYHCYDDGKIRPSRHYMVYLTGKHFLKDRPDLEERVRKNCESSPWLFNEDNLSPKNIILEGVSYEREDSPEICWFMRTLACNHPFWFGIGTESDDGTRSCWGSGELDVDGGLTATVDEQVMNGDFTTGWDKWVKMRDFVPGGEK